MADLNPFSKVLQKHAGRAKEMIRQNLGKADKTTDEDFDLHVKNFNKQQNAVVRLQKEFKNYYACLNAMKEVRRSLLDTVCELYEPCWDGVEQFLHKSEASNSHFEEFCNKINIQVITPVGNYLAQFPDKSTKISKRNRKLLDYDNCRHNLQNLETMKKREEGKIAKAKEQLEEASKNFELLNTELNEELPSLYDRRVSFFATYLQTLFLTEASFHNQDAAIFTEMGNILDKLNEVHKRECPDSGKMYLESAANESATKQSDSDSSLGKQSKMQDGKESLEAKIEELSDIDILNADDTSSNPPDVFCTPPTTTERNISSEVLSEALKMQDKLETESALEASTFKATDYKTLFQVRGTFKYVADDDDELSFDVGDIIDVVEYDNPEEKEEGWHMGVLGGKKGLFPANFTTRI